MISDAHFHRNTFETFLSAESGEFKFAGIHPWQSDNPPEIDLRKILESESATGVGEIGLDRLKTKSVTDSQRSLFQSQLALAAEFHRPVVLHGAKCWGEVVKECRPFKGIIPAFLLHGFSRSEGLVPDIISLNGFISLGEALLNDHAVNYREMAKRLPLERILLETDKDQTTNPQSEHELTLKQTAEMLAQLRNVPFDEIVSSVNANALRFVESLS